MEAVNQQLNHGVANNNIYLKKRVKDQGRNKHSFTMTKESIEPAIVEAKLEKLLSHVEELERRLSLKANEVVEFQVLQQRSELDDLFLIMKRIEERMHKLESSLNKAPDVNDEPVFVPRKFRKK
ncbi:MAG: hypothetical protein LRY71_08715 [Bacillaceae bacterium]|nr:hypothetical protein [Bacillaceae bacterium]